VIGALIAGGFLAGFALGWPLVPLAFGVVVVWCMGRRQDRLVAALIVTACIGGAIRGNGTTDAALSSGWIAPGRLQGVVASGVVDDGRTQRFQFELADGHRLCARAFSRANLGRGDEIEAEIDPDPAAGVSRGYSAYLRANRCEWSGTVGSVTVLGHGSGVRRALDEIRERSARQLFDWVPGDAGGLLAGLVVGDDSLLSDGAMDAFQETGTLHVVAISGSNLTLLVSVLLIASGWSARRRVTEALAMIAIWGYVLVGGASPATVRAGALATASAGARALGRPADLLTLSMQVAAVQAAIWPNTVHGLSYQLSTAAIFGVLIATAGRSFDGLWGGLKLVLATTMLVNVLLLPILPSQSRPSLLLSLIANTLIAPLISVSFVMGLLAMILSVVHPALGEPLALLAGEINEVIITIVTGLSDWGWPPNSLRWSGEQTPTALLWAMALAVALVASLEFRRAVGDLIERSSEVSERQAMIAVGGAAGSFAAIIALAFLR
jgi:ComEC/Rec2-related protein